MHYDIVLLLCLMLSIGMISYVFVGMHACLTSTYDVVIIYSLCSSVD